MQVSTPLLRRYLDQRAARGKEDLARAGERRGTPQMARPQGGLIWCHAASVGEALSLLAVVQRLVQDYPQMHVMVTTGTVTSAKLMAERLPQGAFHQYVPVDHPQWVASFMDHWRPDVVIWSESELWPCMLSEIGRRNIPAILLNARMSESSFKWWFLARGFMRGVLGAFDLCLAQNTAECQRLEQLGAQSVKVSANLKYAAKLLPVDEAKKAELRAVLTSRRILVYASTHPGEEEIALETHRAVAEKVENLLTVIVPRHPVRGKEIEDLAAATGLPLTRRSVSGLPRGTESIYIADTLGELGLFFSLAEVVVMGGSFADIGGHNPIEPAQFGRLIVYGPQMYNFIGICHDFETRGAAIRVADTGALVEKLCDIFAHPATYQEVSANAAALTLEKSHIIGDLMKEISPLIDRAMAGSVKGCAA